jgi:hypothetical protein
MRLSAKSLPIKEANKIMKLVLFEDSLKSVGPSLIIPSTVPQLHFLRTIIVGNEKCLNATRMYILGMNFV